MDSKVTFKVFNRITGEEITHQFLYLISRHGNLYIYDAYGELTRADDIHEVRYDR